MIQCVYSWAHLLTQACTPVFVENLMLFTPRIFGAITPTRLLIELESHLALSSAGWTSTITSVWIILKWKLADSGRYLAATLAGAGIEVVEGTGASNYLLTTLALASSMVEYLIIFTSDLFRALTMAS